MKKLLFFLLTFLVFQFTRAQNVGIGTTTPNAKALLDITSTTKGFLAPRMTTSQRIAITTPPNGLMVYDTDKNEFYHYNGTNWQAILNGDYWFRPITSRSRISNVNDSVGIGTASPTEWLDVNGNIRSRNNINADNNIAATGVVSGGALSTGGNLVVAGTSVLSGDVTTNSDININNTSAILQLKSSNVSKGFFQLSGNDVRFGTNSGNPGGKVILRMDGDNMINFEKSAGETFVRLHNAAGISSGVLQTVSSGNRLSLTNPIANGTVELGGEIFINNTTNRTGIGTSSPTQRLHVNGNAYVSGYINVEDAYIYGRVRTNLIVDDTVSADVIGGAYVSTGQLSVGTFASAGSGLLSVGYNVLTNADGACIIADGTSSYMTNSTSHSMVMRFNNGYRLFTSTNLSTGVSMLNGANSWSSVSDSTKKENFLYADGNSFLQKIANMKLGSWNYKTQDKKAFRHYGPMAQEFYANFGNDGIGKIGDDTTIASADIDGVMMIAIQELAKERDKVKEQNETLKNKITIQEAEINRLKESERKILERVEKLEAKISAQ
jgi:cytoskeletal protein CcmA (bactofilin family)